jgi:CRISPR-associated protein Cmr2
LLAFIPVDQCLKCARKLHDGFEKIVEPPTGYQGPRPSLSVGIAIGHFMDPLEDLREYAYEAERAAKGFRRTKNALAVHVHPRSGAPTKVRGGWDGGRPLDRRLRKWTAWHWADFVSDKTAFDVRELAGAYRGWTDAAAAQRAVEHDFVRLLKRKRARRGRLPDKAIEALLRLLRAHLATSPADAALLRVADELIVARRLVAALRQARGKPAAGEEDHR